MRFSRVLSHFVWNLLGFSRVCVAFLGWQNFPFKLAVAEVCIVECDQLRVNTCDLLA